MNLDRLSPGIGHGVDQNGLFAASRSTSDHMTNIIRRSLPKDVDRGSTTETRRSMSDHMAGAILRTMTGFAENSAESDAELNSDADHYLASVNDVLELILQTLWEDYCPRPAVSSTNSTISVTVQLARIYDPDRINKARSCLDPRLPIRSTSLWVFQSLKFANKLIPKRGEPWKVPKDLSDPKHHENSKSYKPPVPDPTSG
ncbi:hypothetical protein DPMN_129804 [Dreissena polymorpha]|uniref:Uncharacterized protein n=1 Tax=Dreissena polymorpha TaxID=45954 RepID=A0A9D4H6F4_DREPO|nr:hypothetical protein DPMN_129804 [Dreissena polymorpha]